MAVDTELETEEISVELMNTSQTTLGKINKAIIRCYYLNN